MRKIFPIYLIIIFLYGTISFAEDNNKIMILKPRVKEITIPTNKDRKDYFECEKISNMIYETKEIKEKDLTTRQKRLFDRYDDLIDINTVGGIGCSWYCGGGPYKIEASSELRPYENYNYTAKNAHDFDAYTAWIEGKKDYGVGEHINYFFKPFTPPVTAVKILNGYIKDEKSWKYNSRVKTFRLHINGNPYAILSLEDTKLMQIFDLKRSFQSKNEQDLILRFEIADIYPGEKYKDVAITEIEFDGTGVH